MRLRIRHVTTYAYAGPVSGVAQVVRVTPRDDAGQRVEHWDVQLEVVRPGADGADDPFTVPCLAFGEDGYGNRVHLVTLATPLLRARLVATGVVETAEDPVAGRDPQGALPASYWLRDTPLAEAGPGIRRFLADEGLASLPSREWQIEAAERIVRKVRDRIDFRIGVTDVGTSAEEAFRTGAGVCQDHAHVLIAVARALGIPARYVSGYFWPGRGDPVQASHAWVDLFLGGAWESFDPANACRPGGAYVRTAVGLDYFDSPPTRGIRRGSFGECLDVSVEVEPEPEDPGRETVPARTSATAASG